MFGFICLFMLISFVYAEDENNSELAKEAKSAIMIEASTGSVIYEKNSHEELPMASMTKIMTMLIIMENIDNGKLKLTDEVTASEHASSMGGSQIFLEPGEKMTVEEMLKGIAIGSGNDAAVAMAEKIGGTEEGFVKMMNDKAVELGLKNTHFDNACGLDSDNHYSSSYDMAMISKELVKHKKILEYTGTYEDYLRKDSNNSFWLVNTNKLVRFYQGVDGLKTGFTNKAGYCITTTAMKDGMRLITVVMGEPSSSVRNSETTSMLDYGFNLYKVNRLISTDTVINKALVEFGKEEIVNIVPVTDINVLSLKSDSDIKPKYKYNLKSIKAPVKVGDIVGNVDIYENDTKVNSVELTVEEDIDKVNIFIAILREFRDIVLGDL